MEVRVFKSYKKLSQAAAQDIIKQVRNKPNSNLGLATGSTPVGLYKELIDDHKINKTSYKNIISFNLDEYFGIDSEHPQSYYHFMMENLFKDIDIDKEKIHIPSGDAPDIVSECEYYNKILDKHTIDVQVLGIGTNGHIGFNEPGTSFDSMTHFIKLDEKTRMDNARFFESFDEVPTHAVTMGIKNILDSKKIVLIATGKSKAEAVYGMVKGPMTTECPASALQMHDHVVVYLDEEAASKL